MSKFKVGDRVEIISELVEDISPEEIKQLEGMEAEIVEINSGVYPIRLKYHDHDRYFVKEHEIKISARYMNEQKLKKALGL